MDNPSPSAPPGAGPPVPSWHLHRRLYNWVLHWADTPYGAWALALFSFAESSFFPVPPDVLLAPLTLGNRRKWWHFALSCSLASVVGGILGYAIGMFLWAGVGDFFHDYVPGFDRDQLVQRDGATIIGLVEPIGITAGVFGEVQFAELINIRTPNGTNVTVPHANVDLAASDINPFTRVGALYHEYDWKIVAAAGFTPLPYKVFTITAGVFEINFLIFCIASTVSRSARFFLVAGLFARYGVAIKPFIDKYFNVLCIAFLVLLIGGFVALKYL